MLPISNTEGAKTSPHLPRASESETVVVARTETSHTKNLSMLHFAAVGECVANDDIDIVKEGVSVANQECLLSGSNERSGGLEPFSMTNLISLVERFRRGLSKRIHLVCWLHQMKVVEIVILEGMRQNWVTRVYRVVMCFVFYGQSCSRVVVVVLRDACQVKSLWKGWAGLLQWALCLILKVEVLHVNQPVVIFSGCQLLESLFLVLPNMVGQVTALLNWSLMREKEPLS